MSTRLPPFRSSRQRYRRFVEDYLRGRLDEADKPGGSEQGPDVAAATENGRFGRLRGLRPRGKRREYLFSLVTSCRFVTFVTFAMSGQCSSKISARSVVDALHLVTRVI